MNRQAIGRRREGLALRPRRSVYGTVTVVVVLFAVAASWPALAREIVFECPCTAEWVADPADPSGEAGELTLSFGMRSYRPVESGELRVAEHRGTYTIGGPRLNLDEKAFPSRSRPSGRPVPGRS